MMLKLSSLRRGLLNTLLRFSRIANQRNKSSLSSRGVELLICSTGVILKGDQNIIRDSLLRSINAKLDVNEAITADNIAPWIGTHWIYTIGHYVHSKTRGRGLDPTGDVEQGVIMTIDARYKEALERSYFYKDEAKPRDENLPKLFQQLRSEVGCKTAVISSMHPKEIHDRLIKQFKMDETFDFLFSSEALYGGAGMGPVYQSDTGNTYSVQETIKYEREKLRRVTSKPNPGLIMHAIDAAGYSSSLSKVAFVGCSAREIKEGKLAGCGLIIGINESETTSHEMRENERLLKESGADLVVNSLSQLL